MELIPLSMFPRLLPPSLLSMGKLGCRYFPLGDKKLYVASQLSQMKRKGSQTRPSTGDNQLLGLGVLKFILDLTVDTRR